jgi:predicted exporter
LNQTTEATVNRGSQLIRSGSEDFFPPHLATQLTELNSFPASKWGFITYDIKQEPIDWTRVETLCFKLKSVEPISAKIECALSPTSRAEELKDWARDYPLRHPYEGTEAVQEMTNNTLAKSLMLPDRDLVGLLRHDPFGSVDEFMERLLSKNLIKLDNKNGFLFDAEANRVVIPLLFNHDPMQTEGTEPYVQAANSICDHDKACSEQIGFTGSFFAAVENKHQVMADLAGVSWISVLSIILFFAMLIWARLGKLVVLTIPVVVGLLAGCATMIGLYGGIHGIVIGFGAGIVGESVYYGFHAAFHGLTNRHIWKSNFFALMTTCVVLVVISFSSIPLLRQLMIFTLVGITVSFATIYVTYGLIKKSKLNFDLEPLKFVPKERKSLGVLSLVFAVIGLAGMFLSEHNLNLYQLNYMTPRTMAISAWMHQKTGKMMPLFAVHREDQGKDTLENSVAEWTFAKEHQIRIENVAAYTPAPAVQDANEKSWFGATCNPSFETVLSPSAAEFFRPYFQDFNCQNIKPITLAKGELVPSYIKHLNVDQKWLTIWMPNGSEQSEKIRTQYPDVFSLLDVAASFPKLLQKELTWMLPISICLILGILVIQFRKPLHIIAALLPFFSGMGALFLVMAVLDIKINFIIIVTMLMLLGSAVDYGIFVTDCVIRNEGIKTQTSSCLIFSALSTASGMAPLVLAKHPVMFSLGLPLCIGIPAALAAAFWGVPFFLRVSSR